MRGILDGSADPVRALAAAGPYAALVFDCDGTLVDSGPAHEAAWRDAFAGAGIAMPGGWYAARAGLGAEELIAAMARATGSPLDPARVQPAHAAAYAVHVRRVRAREPVAAVARAGYGRVPLAVASSGRRANVVRSLRAAGLYGLFDAVAGRDDVERGKPAPDAYLCAARRLGCDPADCVAFEDTGTGIAAARAAGMRVVDVGPP